MRQQAANVVEEQTGRAELAPRRLDEAEIVRFPDPGNVADRMRGGVRNRDAGEDAEEQILRI